MRAACGLATVASAIALLLGTVGAHAQSYPTRSVKIVVPATPGGAIDMIARLVGDKLTASMGQSVVVENKPGASNNLGTDFVAKSPPDGYSLVIVASSHATNKFLFKQMPFDPVTDFEPIVFTHVVPLLLAVHPSVPAKNVQELIAWIKANPDKASFASSGREARCTWRRSCSRAWPESRRCCTCPTAAAPRPIRTCSAAAPR